MCLLLKLRNHCWYPGWSTFILQVAPRHISITDGIDRQTSDAEPSTEDKQGDETLDLASGSRTLFLTSEKVLGAQILEICVIGAILKRKC